MISTNLAIKVTAESSKIWRRNGINTIVYVVDDVDGDHKNDGGDADGNGDSTD